jgi:hypothetical protein
MAAEKEINMGKELAAIVLETKWNLHKKGIELKQAEFEDLLKKKINEQYPSWVEHTKVHNNTETAIKDTFYDKHLETYVSLVIEPVLARWNSTGMFGLEYKLAAWKSASGSITGYQIVAHWEHAVDAAT